MELLDFLILILSVIAPEWLGDITKYDLVVVETGKTLPGDAVAIYTPSKEIVVWRYLPMNQKVIALLHEFAHFEECINHSRVYGKDEPYGYTGGHNDLWRSIFSDLIYEAAEESIIDIDAFIDELSEFKIFTSDLPILSSVLGLPDFEVENMYEFQNIEEMIRLEIEEAILSYDE